MKTIFDKTVNGKSVKLELKETTGTIFVTVDGRQRLDGFRELYFVDSYLWNDYGIQLSLEERRETSALVQANKPTVPTPAPVNLASEARASGDINKFSKGGAL